ncbi:MAG TPA: 7-carboxy-7-deazaguanine synthase QueE [Patescibacteria group bacterium]|nr:7-carboxy-7-deazaguanine synthase QueE [Patescibacteria group bacterium]
MKGKISEIFDSIQGEGLYFGEKQFFLRLFGCNLNCRYCDTRLHRFAEYESQEVADKFASGAGTYHSVAFTGGEPLLQKDFLKELLQFARQAGLRTYLETNGTLPAALEEVIELVDIVAMDLKLPSSTSLEPFWQEHRAFLKIASRKEVFLKVVVCSTTTQADLAEAIHLIKEIDPSAILVLQPNSYEDSDSLGAKLDSFKETCDRQDVICCVIPQIHKILGVK